MADVSSEEIERYQNQARQRALIVERGDPHRLILAKEKALGADLIVIGKSERLSRVGAPTKSLDARSAKCRSMQVLRFEI
jgi:hypothetical protein